MGSAMPILWLVAAEEASKHHPSQRERPPPSKCAGGSDQGRPAIRRPHTSPGTRTSWTRGTPDGTSVLVVNRRDGSLGVHDATSLALRGSVSVIAQPEDVVV